MNFVKKTATATFHSNPPFQPLASYTSPDPPPPADTCQDMFPEAMPVKDFADCKSLVGEAITDWLDAQAEVSAAKRARYEAHNRYKKCQACEEKACLQKAAEATVKFNEAIQKESRIFDKITVAERSLHLALARKDFWPKFKMTMLPENIYSIQGT